MTTPSPSLRIESQNSVKTGLLVTRIILAAIGVLALSTYTTSLTAQDAKQKSVDVSGTLFGNYGYEGAAGPTKGDNKFDLERAYLTLRSQVNDKVQIRLTTDVFQQSGGSWTLRAKYAYLQYQYFKNEYTEANVRVGIIPTLVIDYEEKFWPRWLSQTPMDRAKYFSSADVGVSTSFTFPSQFVEVYGAVTNGPGYAEGEKDRFKDYQARIALTPFSGARGPSLIRSFAIVPYYYKGTLASTIPDEDAGLKRDRYGVFAGIKDNRVAIGFDFAQRNDGADSLAITDRITYDTHGRLLAAYTTVKPVQLFNAQSKSPIGIVLRYDRVTPDIDFDAYTNAVIGGITCDIGKNTAIALNYQEVTPKNGATMAPSKRYALNWVVNF